jgi:hypothetical protein
MKTTFKITVYIAEPARDGVFKLYLSEEDQDGHHELVPGEKVFFSYNDIVVYLRLILTRFEKDWDIERITDDVVELKLKEEAQKKYMLEVV